MIAHNGSVNTNRSAAVSNFTGSSQSAPGKVRIQISNRTEKDAGVREARNDGAAAAENESRAEEARRRREELREDVVAVSEDGDTVQVSEEGNEELIESRSGNVTAREENNVDASAVQAERIPADRDRPEIDAPEIEAPMNEAIETTFSAIEARQNETQQAQQEQQARQAQQEEAAENEAAETTAAANEAAKAAEPPEPSQEPPAEVRRAEAQADIREAEARERTREAVNDANEAQAEAAADAAKEAQAAAESKPQSQGTFAGVSNQQLQQMYRDGQISRYDYDQEIAARKTREEELRADNEELSEQAAVLQTQERFVTNSANEIRNATSENASETLTAQQRLEAIDKIEQGNSEKARREEEQGRLWDYQLLT